MREVGCENLVRDGIAFQWTVWMESIIAYVFRHGVPVVRS